MLKLAHAMETSFTKLCKASRNTFGTEVHHRILGRLLPLVATAERLTMHGHGETGIDVGPYGSSLTIVEPVGRDSPL